MQALSALQISGEEIVLAIFLAPLFVAMLAGILRRVLASGGRREK